MRASWCSVRVARPSRRLMRGVELTPQYQRPWVYPDLLEVDFAPRGSGAGKPGSSRGAKGPPLPRRFCLEASVLRRQFQLHLAGFPG